MRRSLLPTARWVLPAALAGGVMALAFTPWVAAWGAVWPAVLASLAMVGLLGSLHRASSPAEGAWAGWAFGTVWVAGGTAWLYVSLHQFGGLPSWLAWVSIAALAGGLSLYMAVAMALWVRWRRRHWGPDALLFSGLWFLAEVARALVFTGFPWAASGYAWIDTPWVALAPWLGVYGVGWGAATAVAALTLAVTQGRGVLTASALVVAGALSLSWLHVQGNQFARPHGAALSVSLIQGNVPQNEKFESTHQIAALGWHTEQLLGHDADLVMGPETVIPFLPEELPEGYWSTLLSKFHQGHTAALFGVPLGSFKEGYTNSVVGVSSSTLSSPMGVYRYNKHHLVPFGEFIPWGFRWFVDLMRMPLGDFNRGPDNAPSFAVKDQWIAPNICYEDLFGEDLAARFTQGPTPAPTIMANVSNLAWFGKDVAIFQHLQVARMRSLEFQRPTLRATNTGATVVIDHQGRVTAALPRNTRGVLQATVQGTQGLTPFARWAGPWGLWPLIAAVAAMLLVLRWRPVK